MVATNLIDAKQECSANKQCSMFYDVYGGGYKFFACEISSKVDSSTAGSVLYKKGDTSILVSLISV